MRVRPMNRLATASTPARSAAKSCRLSAEIEIVARAGYQGIEPWVSEIDQYVKAGGSLADLRKRIADLGLSVESVIGFAEWIVDDDARRAKGLDEAKRIMDMTAEIGGKRLAAPPAGVSEADRLDLPTIAARYRALLELGDQHGVVPQLELWGFARVLNKLSEVTFVAVEAGHPRACILADSYHLYKGGSSYDSVRVVSGAAMHVFHINDYPAAPDRKEHHRRTTGLSGRRGGAAGHAVSRFARRRVSAACCRWKCSTANTGIRMRCSWPAPGWRKPARPCKRHSPEPAAETVPSSRCNVTRIRWKTRPRIFATPAARRS